MKKAVIVDLDGTLYYQRPVQICMAVEMLAYYILHFWRINELKQILVYRHQHNNEENFDLHTFCIKQRTNNKTINKLIQKWLFLKPLKWIKLFKDKNLISYLEEIQKIIPVIVYSDYETHQKLEALNFKPDFEFFFDAKNIRFLKPNPQGLSYITERLKLTPKEIFVIGDRQNKDGLAASTFGAEYLILPQNPIKRNKLLKNLSV
ncbi:MAG TPA: hypothetical protein DIC64_02280 [Alphaproteobacteria bacterium]|nr:hypothetical protein [Alphaproteobacteria bacterium]